MTDTPRLPWFRVYSEILDDRKIERVCKTTSQPKAVILGVWITLLALANDSPIRGACNVTETLHVTLDDISYETGIDTDALETIIGLFTQLNMIENGDPITITNWDKRQFRSDSSSERVKKHRQAQDVALQKRYSNALDTDTDTDTEEESDSTTGNAQPPEKQPNIFTFYEQNIGALTPIIADRLKEAEQDYPADWLPEAFKVAIENNARNWAYVHAILERWKADGYKVDKRPPGKNGKSARAQIDRTSDSARNRYAEE